MSRGKDRLRHKIQQEFKSINKQILDLAELVVAPDHFQQFRKKVLNVTNDVRRNLEADLELNYDITYEPSTVCEDIVVIGTGKVDYKGRGKK